MRRAIGRLLAGSFSRGSEGEGRLRSADQTLGERACCAGIDAVPLPKRRCSDPAEEHDLDPARVLRLSHETHSTLSACHGIVLSGTASGAGHRFVAGFVAAGSSPAGAKTLSERPAPDSDERGRTSSLGIASRRLWRQSVQTIQEMRKSHAARSSDRTGRRIRNPCRRPARFAF